MVVWGAGAKEAAGQRVVCAMYESGRVVMETDRRREAVGRHVGVMMPVVEIGIGMMAAVEDVA